jgi:hypothetical protein
MKNLLIYYFQILLPLPLLIWVVYTQKPSVFVTTLILYLLYRQYIDSNKLFNKGYISNIGRFSPLLQIKYFRNLYFE